MPESIPNVKSIFGSKNLQSTNNKSKDCQKLKIVNIYCQSIQTLSADRDYVN